MTAVAAPGRPAPARRLGLRGGLRNTFTLTWRSVLKMRTNMEDVLGLSLNPIMFPQGAERDQGLPAVGLGPLDVAQHAAERAAQQRHGGPHPRIR